VNTSRTDRVYPSVCLSTCFIFDITERFQIKVNNNMDLKGIECESMCRVVVVVVYLTTLFQHLRLYNVDF
jgi:hypothetical protein